MILQMQTRVNTLVDEMSTDSFADWFRARLKAHTWSPAEFARRADVPRATVYTWVRGTRVPDPASCDLHTIEPVARESLWHRLQSIASADEAHARALAITSATSDQTRRQLEERLAHHRDRAAELFQMRIGREIGPDEFMAARDIEESAIAAITADLAALPAPLPLMAFRDAHAVLIDAAAFIRTWSDDDLRRVVSLIGATAYLDLGAKSVSWAFVEPYETLLVRGTI